MKEFDFQRATNARTIAENVLETQKARQKQIALSVEESERELELAKTAGGSKRLKTN